MVSPLSGGFVRSFRAWFRTHTVSRMRPRKNFVPAGLVFHVKNRLIEIVQKTPPGFSAHTFPSR